MGDPIRLEELVETSGVRFGTSGARGLVTAMTDRVCYGYASGFLALLAARGELGKAVALAGDRRPSTPRIMAAVARAITDAGCEIVNYGQVPTPALALAGFAQGAPSIMVTGSHIPADRNGLKFTTGRGELLKRDEGPMLAGSVELPADLDGTGMFATPPLLPPARGIAAERYAARFADAFGPALRGMTVGVYGHSAVGRSLFVEVLRAAGAEVLELGFSESFVPVDTEALRPEDVELGLGWARQHRFDALVSTDGDSDRPLVAGADGRWLRGDVIGILCAKALGADVVVTPVSSNTAVEQCGWFRKVVRTKIGSPYVIEAMMREEGVVVGYEANGGFLQHSDTRGPAGPLPALPTRDAFVVALALLATCAKRGMSLVDLAKELPPRFTASDRIAGVESSASAALLRQLESGGATAATELLGDVVGELESIDGTDGLRMRFDDGRIVHLRPSGNAPELRCYAEAEDEATAARLVEHTLGVVARRLT